MLRVAALPLGLVVLAACGCAPHVEWRADSEAFYYSRADGLILEYDIARKSLREITRIDPDKERETIPGFDLRPDGKVLVVVESTAIGNDTPLVQTTLRIVDLDGKTEKTATLEWRAADEGQAEPKAVATFVEWSPTARHVLVATQLAIALWDVENGTIRPHETVHPLLPQYMGASPWRPDGRALLALGDADEPENLVLVGVDGSVAKFDTDDAFDGADQSVPPRGEWQGDTLVATLGMRRVTIDTKSRTVTGEDVEARAVREYPLGKAVLRLDTSGEKPRLDWRLGDRTIALGGDLGATFSLAHGPVVLSPDGKRAVVVRQMDLVIVDESGIVTKLNGSGEERNAR